MKPKREPRQAPFGRDENVPLTREELAKANAESCKPKFRPASTVIREPEDNTIGQYKILQRIDGLFVIHDTKRVGKGDLGNGLVFWTENGAKTFAKADEKKVDSH